MFVRKGIYLNYNFFIVKIYYGLKIVYIGNKFLFDEIVNLRKYFLFKIFVRSFGVIDWLT